MIPSSILSVNPLAQEADSEAAGTEDQSLFTLGRDRLFVLRDAQRTRVFCLSGALWVTEDERITDLVLRPGQAFVVAHTGLVLVMALEPSTFRVMKKDDPNFLRRLAHGLSRRLKLKTARRSDD
ncbi:MAG TPA: DUF2917 domain-containing protein [Burkholderiales bacterium]|nr:DUF2917 domain-containing protein [Burkholderiales bacterium]